MYNNIQWPPVGGGWGVENAFRAPSQAVLCIRFDFASPMEIIDDGLNIVCVCIGRVHSNLSRIRFRRIVGNYYMGIVVKW